jgi:hypothetical protein
MGKRSRKRVSSGAEPPTATQTSRVERDAARQRRAEAQRHGQQDTKPKPRPGRVSPEDRPPPIWAPFPLTELVTLGGIVLMVWGLLSGGGRDGNARLAAGLAVASLAGLELAAREHVTGFRSHSALLAGVLAILVMVALGLGAGVQILGVLLIAGALAFLAAFFGLRALFRRRSGGLSFR